MTTEHMAIGASILLVLLLVDLLTSKIGEGGIISRNLKRFVILTLALVGYAISSLMIWKGSNIVALIGVAAFALITAPLVRWAHQWSVVAERPPTRHR